MKSISKVIGLGSILAMLFLAACTPPPPPISKDQLSKAEEETTMTEKRAAGIAKQRAELQQEVDERNSKLSTLKQMEAEMQ
ncbi:MAG TPA: hypothetical protein PL063_00115 [Candidatus Cloacimonadota bacterium]|jgi:hypothetical protein|nr:hypothetical protein [Candidatus Cloacimonadales bacterium]HOE91635.1 hypothetical protein [Candidatus Cloacimonadota bacterium]HPK40460.1 hypothetical protein [Candidatus Cloacimonadota bacterium]HPY95594.1 hypothetical protein [Candidatus Cloacimonadota bacterium]HQB40162.1 hypothetical protein [Candidatus Cloacimonadota bacterium]